MLKTKKAITVRVENHYNIEVQRVIDKQVETIGTQYIYSDTDNVYIGFETKSTVEEVAETLKKALNVDTVIVGALVIVRF